LDRAHPARGLATVMEGRDAIAEGFRLDDRVWLSTNLDAPNYRIVATRCQEPEDRQWETVIPEGPDVIQGFDRTRDRIAVLRLVRAPSRLTTYDLRGADEREIGLPSLGAVELVDGDRVGDGVGYTFQSFTQPPIAFVADARTGEAQQVARLAMPRGLDIGNIAVEQTTYPSRDGTP